MSPAPAISQWHVLTSEFPPQPGGVADFAAAIAAGLTQAGDEVHVWCPPAAPAPDLDGALHVHRTLTTWGPAGWRRLGKELDAFVHSRRLFVQWVPHGYGYRSLNLAFCLWLWRRARRGEEIDLMVHEPFVAFHAGSWRQDLAAVLHRLMAVILLRAARRIWVSIPAWEELLRPFALGRRLEFRWLPLGTPVVERRDPRAVAAVRKRYAPAGQLLVAHFSAHGPGVTALLWPALRDLLGQAGEPQVLLLGRGGRESWRTWTGENALWQGRLHAAGPQSADTLSWHLQACDLMLQPYPDGASSRRTSLLAALAHGRAVVSNEGWLTDPIWRESGAVALSPTASAGALAAACRQLLDDEGARRALGERARALFAQRFDIRHAVAALRQADGERP